MDPNLICIVLVEDHIATRDAVAQLISQELPRACVLGVHSAEALLELCARELPQLVVMDISLPGMNGIEASRQLTSRFAALRVVMLSNYDMQVYRDGALAAGACAFVSKQRIHQELTAVLRAQLGLG